MDKSEIIKMRDTLKAGKNLPLIIYIDNMHRLINEANALQFTKWDDNNGILYSFALTNPVTSISPSNIGGEVSVAAFDYEIIQGMEIVRLPLVNLIDVMDSVSNSGATLTDETKERVLSMFTQALNPDLVNLGPGRMNEIMRLADGEKAVNDNDDYYNGKFTEPFKETRAHAAHNAYIDSLKEKADEDEGSEG